MDGTIHKKGVSNASAKEDNDCEEDDLDAKEEDCQRG
jgi:hypothetical protein